MTPAELISVLRLYPHAVQASVTPAGAPQAAVVGVAVTDTLEIVFDTLGRSRKARNLRQNPRIAFVLGGDDMTIQYEGVADEPFGAELHRLEQLLFERFPERARSERPADLTYFRVRPLWIRCSRLRNGAPETREWTALESTASATRPLSAVG